MLLFRVVQQFPSQSGSHTAGRSERQSEQPRGHDADLVEGLTSGPFRNFHRLKLIAARRLQRLKLIADEVGFGGVELIGQALGQVSEQAVVSLAGIVQEVLSQPFAGSRPGL